MLALERLEFGAGRPLVILHGLFGAARNWATIGRRLGEQRHVVALDQRNHGGSPWVEDMTYPTLAGDVRDVIAPLGRSAVLGHSMGGKAAMTLALLYPGLVERLVVVDIAPVAYGGRHHGGYIRAMQEADLSAVRRRSEVEEMLRDSIEDPAIRAFLMQNLAPAEDGGMRWRLNLDVLAGAIPDIMGWPGEALAGRRYEGPVLVLIGGRSDYVQPEHHARIRNYFPQARTESLPECGHWPHAEQPESFLRLLQPFLQSG